MSCSQSETEILPAWFDRAVADRGDVRAAQVRGARVEYRVWGPAGAPVVVLIHGGAAHAGWWDHLAPLLAERYRVAALDLTGHGSSDSRREYDVPTWCEEVLAVAAAEGVARPFVVGHSMGGVVAIATALAHADEVAGTVAIDPPEWFMAADGLPPRRLELPARRFHATQAQAAERFRARPPDQARVGFVERHVATRSVRRTENGWAWRFDHEVTRHGGFPVELWERRHGPMMIVLAERSLLTVEQQAELRDRMPAAGVVTIRDSGHHVLLDQPLALLACVEAALAGWTSASAMTNSGAVGAESG